MCKFCSIKTLNKRIGEKSNGSKRVLGFNDGTQSFDLYLSRYMIDSENIHRNTLNLDLGVKMEGGRYTLKDKQISIKYCPFCGEEL